MAGISFIYGWNAVCLWLDHRLFMSGKLLAAVSSLIYGLGDVYLWLQLWIIDLL